MKLIFFLNLIAFSALSASKDYQIVCRNGVNHLFEKSSAISSQDFLGPCPQLGDRVTFANGSMQTFLQVNPDGTPYSYGLGFPAKTLEDLPSKDNPNDFQNCFDADENGSISEKECVGGHFRFLFFPKKNLKTPIKWSSISFSPVGRLPPLPYDLPVFEFRFNLMDFSKNNSIKLGPCPGLTNCEDYALASKDVPEKYLPKGYSNLNIIEGKVGNLLVDTHGFEFDPKKRFRQSFILGSFDGHLSFFEVMVSLEELNKKKTICLPIKQADSYEELGHYPTKYCVKYWVDKEMYFVTLEGFVRKRK